jgi:hypothetical protein
MVKNTEIRIDLSVGDVEKFSACLGKDWASGYKM